MHIPPDLINEGHYHQSTGTDDGNPERRYALVVPRRHTSQQNPYLQKFPALLERDILHSTSGSLGLTSAAELVCASHADKG